MRLLKVESNGAVSLTKDLTSDIPPYAILSHTWGDDDDEVTFKDLTDGSGKMKRGYDKIKFCAVRAKIDELQYIWIDTCCINKSDSVELSEAIISMFRWYREAAKCYVYLADVPTPVQDSTAQLWVPGFRKSRWFKRGWTLQELIAPSVIEFFSVEGQFLGSKDQLEQLIHEITGIAVKALQGHALANFSIAERLSWAESRDTKRKEDKAYSLLGICNVNMLPMYGEGMENAFRRLHEEIDKRWGSIHEGVLLDQLPNATEASFNAYQRQHDPSCLPQTRVELLQDIYNWADGQNRPSIFWLNGLAGTGKSTIARTVSRYYFDKKLLGASFFFSLGGGDVGHASKFVTSIAVQLANCIPSLEQLVCNAFKERRDIASQSLRDQWQQLVLRPLSVLDRNGDKSSYVLVIDALDECDNYNDIRTIIHLLFEAASSATARLRIFITSRPEIPIRHGFGQLPDEGYQAYVLHKISPSIIDHDIFIFFEYNLGLIRDKYCLDACWPDEETVRRLIQITAGLFIWASTSCRFISEGKRFAPRRLDTILQGGSSSGPTAPEKHLDEIYTTVLKQSVAPEYTNEEKEEAFDMLRTTLGSIVVLLSPLSTLSLSRLLNIRIEIVNQTLNDLHSVLDVPKDQSLPLRLHHPSFRDYLLNNRRCKDLDLWVDENQSHQMIAKGCIRLMSKALHQNICSTGAPGTLVAGVKTAEVEQQLTPHVQYACRYWIQHVVKSSDQLSDNDRVHCFLKKHFLHWLEALGWMGIVPDSVYAITSLESFANSNNCPLLSSFIHDAKRFLLYNRAAIEMAPLQAYSSALIFAPTRSIIRESFKDCTPTWIQVLPNVEEGWGTLLQTLEGHSAFIYNVVFSPDGKTLASASWDSTVKVWDTESGTLLQTLEGHSDRVIAVVFSPDGKMLASASRDSTIKVWDAGSGAMLRTLEGHSSRVNAVAYSPDGKTLVSASRDSTVKIWHAECGTLLQTLEGHSDRVDAVSFSPDGKTLASASADNTVKMWDAGSGALVQTLEGHSDCINAIAFSPNGKKLASVSHDSTVRVWDTGSGAVLYILDGYSDRVIAVAFSPDSQTLASSAYDGQVKVWDSESGALLQTLKGHSDRVNAVAFSPDGKTLVSASRDHTVKVWGAKLGQLQQTLAGHSSEVNAIIFSPDCKMLASASADSTVKLWDLRSDPLQRLLERHSKPVEAVVFSPDGETLVSWASYDRTIKVWDVRSGAVLQSLEGHTRWSKTVAFSQDSRMLAASAECTIKVWDAKSGTLLQTLEGHSEFVKAVAFSPDGNKLASSAHDYKVKVWDTESGALLQTLDARSSSVNAVFSPDGKLLASDAYASTIKVWDAESGAVLQTLKGHSDWIRVLVFSPDSKTLASAARYTVKIWDPMSGALLRTLKGHSLTIKAVAFSPDGNKLASSAHDKTVKVWDAGSGALQQTLKIDNVDTLAFAGNGTFLQTNRGYFPISSASATSLAIPTQQLSSAIFIEGQWLHNDMEPVLWLPPEQRPECSAFYGTTVCFGHTSGRVTFMKLTS